MFSTPKAELKELLISLGKVTIGDDFIKIENYPFEPSVAFGAHQGWLWSKMGRSRQAVFRADQIDDIDCKFNPAIRMNDELISLPDTMKSELKNFAQRNGIKTVERLSVWSWILEPFLDTEYTNETDQRCTRMLENCGLTADQVQSLRKEIETQMLKYNFDTMLWEWCFLGLDDVLRAMRTKYNRDEFRDFYKRAMSIALLAPRIPIHGLGSLLTTDE